MYKVHYAHVVRHYYYYYYYIYAYYTGIYCSWWVYIEPSDCTRTMRRKLRVKFLYWDNRRHRALQVYVQKPTYMCIRIICKSLVPIKDTYRYDSAYGDVWTVFKEQEANKYFGIHIFFRVNRLVIAEHRTYTRIWYIWCKGTDTRRSLRSFRAIRVSEDVCRYSVKGVPLILYVYACFFF